MAMARFRNIGVSVMRFATAVIAGVSLAAMLAGCTMSDDKLARYMAAPDKYVLYSCPQLADELTTKLAQERKLQGLMARAGQGEGGELVSSIAYQPEYLAAHGEVLELRKAEAAKNCNGIAAVPAAPIAPDGESSNAIR